MECEIKSIKAQKITDSRGNPTLEVNVEIERGIFSASVPSGASRGKREAVAIETEKAIFNVNNIIAKGITGKDAVNQREIDELMIEMDGTENKSNLGANAILGVSLAISRAAAANLNTPLWKYISLLSGQKPFISIPTFNVINGGAHAKNKLSFQEFMLVIKSDSAKDNLFYCQEVYQRLQDLIIKKYGEDAAILGDEGGFAPPLKSAEEAIELILEAAKGKNNIQIAIDAAASQFFEKGKYKVDSKILKREDLLKYYVKLAEKYPIVSLEDPFFEDDWQGFTDIKKEIGGQIAIVGDDLLVTNQKLIEEAEEKRACSGVIIKANQAGTLSQTIEAGRLAKSFGWITVVSHRSGETKDDFISDLAVGLGADYLKAGAPATEYRMAKYKRLLNIEKEWQN
jgi:enolase